MKNNKIELIGDLLMGHDGELYIRDGNNTEHDITKVLNDTGRYKYQGDKARVKMTIEFLDQDIIVKNSILNLKEALLSDWETGNNIIEHVISELEEVIK